MGPVPPKPMPEPNVKTFSLVWLDRNVNVTAENVKLQERLRLAINKLSTCTDPEECKHYINRLAETDRIILISSGSLGQEVVPQVHHLRQVFSIYIFCGNRVYHEQWSKEFIKVRGVFVKETLLVDQILIDINREKYNRVDEQLSLSIFDSERFRENSIQELDKHYVFSRTLIDCLLQLKILSHEKDQFYKLCREEYKSNNTALNFIYQFEQNYASKSAVTWYTDNTFLYKMLIKALRDPDIDRLFLLRFFLADIQQQIKSNHLSESICVYGSQLMSRSELHTLQDCQEKFVSINAFLTAISDRNAALCFFTSAFVTDDVEKVLFEIHADGTLDQIQPFMDIDSGNPNQKQILFSIGSVFRLDGIGFDTDGIKIIKLTLCPMNHQELQPVFNYIEQKYGNTKASPLAFGVMLRKFNKYDEAKKYYDHLLAILPSKHPDLQKCRQAKDEMYLERENYETTRDEIDDKARRSGANYAAVLFQKNRGDRYFEKGDFKRAIDCYQNALNISLASYHDNHPEVGRCYKNLALAYQNDNHHEEALTNYEKAKRIFKGKWNGGHSELSEVNKNIEKIQQYLEEVAQPLTT